MAKYTTTPEQRSYLRAIATKQAKLHRQTEAVTRTRSELQDMIRTAVAMGISSGRIAKVACVSPARISQLKKEPTHG